MKLERLVASGDDGKKLETVLKHGMMLSNSMIVRLKYRQGIYVNGEPVFTNYICRSGDLITLFLSVSDLPSSISPEYGELKILYEDDFILAVSKPEGMLTHPSRTQFTGTLMGYVLGYLSKSGYTACHALNRLDRYTSGIVLFAKSAYAKALFAQATQNAQKEYIAVTYGNVAASSGTIDLPIRRLQSGNIRRVVSDDGAKAVTHYRLLDVVSHCGNDLSVLKLKPETGRTHQLRVHCLVIGHPIIGDQIYHTDNSKAFADMLGIQGQLLHAGKLQFMHPVTKNQIDIKCPPTRESMIRFMTSFPEA